MSLIREYLTSCCVFCFFQLPGSMVLKITLWGRSEGTASFYRWGARAVLAPRSHSFFLFYIKRPFPAPGAGRGWGGGAHRHHYIAARFNKFSLKKVFRSSCPFKSQIYWRNMPHELRKISVLFHIHSKILQKMPTWGMGRKAQYYHLVTGVWTGLGRWVRLFSQWQDILVFFMVPHTHLHMHKYPQITMHFENY